MDYQLHSNGNDEEVLRALYANPQTHNELVDVMPKNSLSRSLSRLKEKGLIEINEKEITLTEFGDLWKANIAWEFAENK